MPNGVLTPIANNRCTMVDPSHFKQILDSLLTSVLVLDDQLNIITINNAAEVLLGVSSDQVVGKPIANTVANLDSSSDHFEQALLANRDFTMRRARWQLHNHTEIELDYSITANQDMHAIIVEVQPLERVLRINREESMHSTHETSRHLVRAMAHEIKNPLGGIRGAAQLLARELEVIQGVDLEEYTQVIIDETDRLRNLVDRMLGPHRAPEYKPTNLHEVCEHVLTVIKAEIGSHIELLRDYDPSIPLIPGDRELLIQAALNVARNAAQVLLESDYADQPSITFKTRIQRRHTIGRRQYPLVARLAIIDNGPGIPEALLREVFFPMITGRPEGTGLGLAIAQNLLAQHNGTIECESRPGHTDFSLFLPLDELYATTESGLDH